jgi:hypothetical protein
MGTVVGPFARCSDPLAGGNHRGMPEPVLFIVVGWVILPAVAQCFAGPSAKTYPEIAPTPVPACLRFWACPLRAKSGTPLGLRRPNADMS